MGQYRTLQIRRGLKSDLNSIALSLAELGYCTDTNELYIGDGTNNNRITSQTGSINIPNGQNTVSITFDNAFSDTTYRLGLSVVNTVDSSPSIYSYIITNKITTGFTVLFSNIMDSANYILEYIAQ